jgi:hypothetical protein
MKEIAICVSTDKVPEAIFSLDLHDASFSYAPLDRFEEISGDMLQELNAIDYGAFWGFEPAIPLPYEQVTGRNFGEVK